jgi:hypothetical protein
VIGVSQIETNMSIGLLLKSKHFIACWENGAYKSETPGDEPGADLVSEG